MKIASQGWSLRKLDELGFVGRGKSRHRPRNDPRLYGGHCPFIQTADVMAADPYITAYSQSYSEFGLSQSKLWPPRTLCMTIAGENTAETAILTFAACFPDSVVGFIPDPEKADVTFVKYALDQMKQRFRAITRGATQDNLSLEKLLSFQIPTPPLPEQQRVAMVIASFDDLIENNTRRISILEEMARRVYEEWCVRFQYPGRNNGALTDSELGLTPSGWPVTPITDICDFVKGVEPGRSAYADEPSEETVPFLRVGDLSKRRSTLFVNRGLARGRELEEPDVAISLDGTIGIVRYGLRGAYSGGIRKVVPTFKHVGRPFLYQYLASEYAQNVIKAHANGATIQHAGSSIGHLKLALPPPEILTLFEQVASPMMDLAVALQRKNATLRATRTHLLAKLISGEIQLSARSQAEALAA